MRYDVNFRDFFLIASIARANLLPVHCGEEKGGFCGRHLHWSLVQTQPSAQQGFCNSCMLVQNLNNWAFALDLQEIKK